MSVAVEEVFDVDVAFRTEVSGEFKGEVTAVFSGEIERGGLSCYAHVGQHSVAGQGWYRQTRPASAEESAELVSELEAIGYRVRKVSRVRWS